MKAETLGSALLAIGLVSSCGAVQACRNHSPTLYGGPSVDASFGGDDTPESIDGGPADAFIDPPPPYPPGKCRLKDTARPPAVPPGWQRYDGFSCDCPLYVQGPKGISLRTVEWEPCPSEFPITTGCQRMSRAWDTSDGEGYLLATMPFWRDSLTGKSFLFISRVLGANRGTVRLVSDLDGGTVPIIFDPANPSCRVFVESIASFKFAMHTNGDGSSATGADGLIAGDWRESYPSLTKISRPNDGFTSNWAVSEGLLVKSHIGLTALSWIGTEGAAIYDPATDPDRLPSHSAMIVGDGDVFWEVSASMASGQMVWTSSNGTRPFLRWSAEAGKAVANFGTDGVDMVWTLGEVPNQTTRGYERYTLMTAPYTADSAAAQNTARSLGPDPGEFDVHGYVVGCGLAAKTRSWNGNDGGIFIARLADGAAWYIPVGASWYLSPVGISCSLSGADTEIVATVGGLTEWGIGASVVRIRLDSLTAAMRVR